CRCPTRPSRPSVANSPAVSARPQDEIANHLTPGPAASWDSGRWARVRLSAGPRAGCGRCAEAWSLISRIRHGGVATEAWAIRAAAGRTAATPTPPARALGRRSVVRGALFPAGGDEVEHARLVDGQGEQTVECFSGGVDAEDAQRVLSEVALDVVRGQVPRRAIPE